MYIYINIYRVQILYANALSYGSYARRSKAKNKAKNLQR